MGEDEWLLRQRKIFKQNQAFAKPNQPEGYQTQLGPAMRSAFMDWQREMKAQGHDPHYDPSPQADYDLPGFFRGLVKGDPHAQQGINANDGQMHYSDYYKTLYHPSFSAESQWAMPGAAPKWVNDYQLKTPNGVEVFNEKTRQRFGQGGY